MMAKLVHEFDSADIKYKFRVIRDCYNGNSNLSLEHSYKKDPFGEPRWNKVDLIHCHEDYTKALLKAIYDLKLKGNDARD